MQISLKKGEVLFREGDPGDRAYLLEEGFVEVYVGSTGGRRVLAQRGAGELVGEMAIIDGKARSASVIALEDCQLMVITPEQLSQRIAQTDPILRVLIETLMERFRRMIADLSDTPGISSTVISDRTPARPAESRKHYEPAVAQIRLERELAMAIENEEFELYYQPIVDLREVRIVGFEALVRWQHATRGMVSPMEFIPTAEATGLIVPLSKLCLRQACESLARMKEAIGSDTPLFVSVNVSGRELREPDFLSSLRRILQETKTDPSGIKLEVTESFLIEEPEDAVKTLKACRRLGTEIALDDFGTGYSSLSQLQHFPVDIIKIDRSFIRALQTDHASRKIVPTVINLARGLGLPTVCEGIESVEDAILLRAYGATHGQGYLFSKPVVEREALRLVTEKNDGLNEISSEFRRTATL